MPVSTEEKVTALSHDFGSQRRLAQMLGVDPAQVTRWRRGEGIDRDPGENDTQAHCQDDGNSGHAVGNGGAQ